ncbi:MAG: DNA polymerase III subunit beta [Parachlamydiaceae bacterium]|nr:DNA polymerase III subunit beta [Parachlamydiaceae bacterium]
MKFVLSTQELNYLINKIQNIIPPKATIPILSNFLIEAINNEIILTATDLTVGIRCDLEAKIIEEGSTTIPAKRFSQLVRELTAANVEVSSSEKEITTIISGTSRFKLNGMSKNEYPALPDMSQASSFAIKQSDLRDMFSRTSFAVSKEDNRYVLTGVFMQIADGIALFAGTDGKRLARSQCPIKADDGFTFQAIIPLKAVDEIVKSLLDEGDAKISVLHDKISIQVNDTLIQTKLLSGEYPDINRVIPERSEIFVTLHRDELMTLLRQIVLFTPNNEHSVRFTFTNGELRLNANSKEIGEGQVSMPVNYEGSSFEIAFNPGFFIDILRHCKNETVVFGLTDSFNPGVITDGEKYDMSCDAPYLFVIMPMRIAEE